MHSSHLAKSSSTASATGTSVTAARVSQSEPVAGQRQQGSFVGLSTTARTPQSAKIAGTYHQQDELRFLTDISVSDISPSQINPLEALATHLTVTFDDENQGQSASSLSLSNEPSRSQRSSQPVNDVVPIVREEQSPETEKWIMMSGNEKKPFQCGYEGCGRKYSEKAHLQAHIITHTGDSKSRCYLEDCASKIIHRDVRPLTQHTQEHHILERPLECKLCNRRFRLPHHLKYHMTNVTHVHSPEAKKKSPKQQSISKSSSAITTTNTANAASTSTMTSRVSQLELAPEQRLQGSYVGISTTVHTPESMHIPLAEQAFSGLRLLAEASTLQIDPFEALAAHRTATFDDKYQEQPDNFSSQSSGSSARIGESSQPSVDTAPNVREAPLEIVVSVLSAKDVGGTKIRTITTIPEQEILPSINDHFQRALLGNTSGAVPSAGIAGDPNLPSFQHLAKPSPDPTDTNQWIIVDNSQERPYLCGYPRCDKSYFKKEHLIRHFLLHTGTSSFRCPHLECVGKEYFRDSSTLKRHMATHSSEKPFQCDRCDKRFTYKDSLNYHREHVYCVFSKKRAKLLKRKKK